jgi:hypothetical protein
MMARWAMLETAVARYCRVAFYPTGAKRRTLSRVYARTSSGIG